MVKQPSSSKRTERHVSFRVDGVLRGVRATWCLESYMPESRAGKGKVVAEIGLT